MIDPVVMQAIGAMSIAIGCFFWGRVVGYNRRQCQDCAFLEQHLGLMAPASKVEEFDQKVDIVCNACGLVGEFE